MADRQELLVCNIFSNEQMTILKKMGFMLTKSKDGLRKITKLILPEGWYIEYNEEDEVRGVYDQNKNLRGAYIKFNNTDDEEVDIVFAPRFQVEQQDSEDGYQEVIVKDVDENRGIATFGKAIPASNQMRALNNHAVDFIKKEYPDYDDPWAYR